MQEYLNASKGPEKEQNNISIDIPSISLPKDGGVIKGIDEKFQVNPSNGTASFSRMKGLRGTGKKRILCEA